MEDFIAIGRDVNESDADQRTPLHYAVAYNHADIVAELVTNGANLEAQVHFLLMVIQLHGSLCAERILKAA